MIGTWPSVVTRRAIRAAVSSRQIDSRATTMPSYAESLIHARSHPGDARAHELLAEAALASQDEAEALPLVAAAAQRFGDNARLWQWSALLHRALDDRLAAIPAFEAATRLAPNDARIAHGLARTLHEAGRPSLAAFERALALAPADGDVLLGMYAAMLAAGDGARAVRELDALLARNPGWIAGHNELLHLRFMLGDQTAFAASIDRALRAMPGNEELWHLLVTTLIRADRFDDAHAAIRRGRDAVGDVPFLLANEAVVLSETGAV